MGIVVETVEAREMGMVVKAAGDGFCSKSAAENQQLKHKPRAEQKEMVSTAAPSLQGKFYLCFEIPFLTQSHSQSCDQKNLSPGGKHKWDCAAALKASPSCHDGRKA